MPGAEPPPVLLDKGSPPAAPPATPATATPAGPSQPRKSSKPAMEKRRRARINESLAQLKALLLEALRKQSSRHSKLEKADILEMTVRHLRRLQRPPAAPAVLNADPTLLGKYRAGFSECVNEVTRFLSTCEGVTAEVRARLLSHLGSCMNQINATNCPAPPPEASFGQALVRIPIAPAAAAAAVVPLTGSAAPGEASGETPKVYGGFRLLPAPDGQFAFLVPSAAFAPHGNAVIPLYTNTGGLLPPTPAVSPGSGSQSLPADSVWRPW